GGRRREERGNRRQLRIERDDILDLDVEVIDARRKRGGRTPDDTECPVRGLFGFQRRVAALLDVVLQAAVQRRSGERTAQRIRIVARRVRGQRRLPQVGQRWR